MQVKKNLNCIFLELKKILPLKIDIILNNPSLYLTLKQWVLLTLSWSLTTPKPKLFFIKNKTWASTLDYVTLNSRYPSLLIINDPSPSTKKKK